MRKTQKRQSKKLIKNIGGRPGSKSKSKSRRHGSISVSKSVRPGSKSVRPGSGRRQYTIFWITPKDYDDLSTDADFIRKIDQEKTSEINIDINNTREYNDIYNKIKQSWITKWIETPPQFEIIYRYYKTDTTSDLEAIYTANYSRLKNDKRLTIFAHYDNDKNSSKRKNLTDLIIFLNKSTEPA
jgi:hypothetical protein